MLTPGRTYRLNGYNHHTCKTHHISTGMFTIKEKAGRDKARVTLVSKNGDCGCWTVNILNEKGETFYNSKEWNFDERDIRQEKIIIIAG